MYISPQSTIADLQHIVKQQFANYHSVVDAMVLQIEDANWGWVDFAEYYNERFRKTVNESKQSPPRLLFRLIPQSTLTNNTSGALDGISDLCEDCMLTDKDDG
jgi:hypothetical protein